MPNVTLTATLMTTRRVEKYGGVRIALEALEQMRDQIKLAGMPLHMNHRATEALDANVLDVRIERMADDEYALVIDLEADEADWGTVEEKWSVAGVPGGFSAAFTENQEAFSGPPVSPVTLISDAGVYTDDDRATAARLISDAAPVSVLRLFQFSEPEFAKIAIEFSREVGAGLLVAGVGYLVGRHSGQSHIEMRRAEPDGTTTTAVLDTSDPDVVRAAAQSLDSREAPPAPALLVYNEKTESWEPESRD
jgi:hypothetical protein